jgi:hypothetical protein
MARKFVVGIDLLQNELINARVVNLGSAPSTPVEGQIYFNNTAGNKILYFYNGTEWIPASGSLEVIQDAINTTFVAGTGLDKTYDDDAGTFTLDIDSTVTTLTGSQTLTNKTLTSPVLGGTTTTASGNLVVNPATSILEVQGDGASVVGQIQLNCHVNSHGQKIASQPHSENATNTLKLPGGTTIGNSDATLVSDTGTQTLTNKTLTSPVITGLDATTVTKGLAFFDGNDFNVTGGAVELEDTVVKTVTTDSGALTPSAHGLSILGGEGIDVTHAGTSITVAAEDATTTNKGVASFADADFTVTSGAVTIKNVDLATQTTGNYIATIAGTANEVEVSGSGSENSAVTIGLPNDVTITNNLTVGGDLNVTGTINSVNTTQVNIVDNKINLNTDFTGSPTADAGIRVERGEDADVEILWNETNDNWTLTNNGTNYHAIVRKYASDITTTEEAPFTFVATHNLGTRDVTVQVFATASPYNQIECDVDHTSTSVVTLTFAAQPTAGQYRVVITG